MCSSDLTIRGNKTYTATFTGGARSYARIVVWEFSYSGTASFDTDDTTGQGAYPTNPSSGAITTTGTDEVVLGGYGEYAGTTFTSFAVNGVAADGSVIVSGTASWYRLLLATFTGGTASAVITEGSAWICSALAIKVTAAGGGLSIPVVLKQYRARRN